MRQVIREHIELGVDSIKLSMSGEEVRLFDTARSLLTAPLTCCDSQIVETKPANETYFSEEEVAACVDEGSLLNGRAEIHVLISLPSST